MNKAKRLVALALALTLAAGAFSGCWNKDDSSSSGGSGSASSGSGKVYFLNFKPEVDSVWQTIAKEYTQKTGVQVKVTTAASGTYEEQLKSEMAKKEAPTIFQVNGPVGYASWADWCADISGSKLAGRLREGAGVLGDGEKIYGIPYTVEGYGIIVNTALMDRYFALEGAKAKSLEEIDGFEKLKAVVEDMQAKKAELGIDGVFASTSLLSGEDWRWQTHLANVALAPEFDELGADMTDAKTAPEITFKYAENFKNLFDLYLDNSTIDAKLSGSKTVNDSMAEFALGKCAMVQNGNWGYSQIAGVEGNVVQEGDVAFLPMYMGLPGEESQGIAIGTENFLCINAQASEADRKASLDFLDWLFSSEEGKAHVKGELGFIAPFDTFTAEDAPADPLGRAVVEWQNRDGVKNTPWDFTIFPSQTFKDNFGSALLRYAQGSLAWDELVRSVVADWKTEKANIA